ncbi:MAG: hypothetical protein HPY55_07305 [Firmicutes bacterium]|nr:hypothetical protein [Bacillota bacterium]
MSADSMVLMAAICIALNTLTLILILVMLSGMRQSIQRMEARLSTLAARAEDEVLSTLREFRGVASEARGMIHTGAQVVEKMAFASILGRLSGRSRLSSMVSSIVMGLNLAQSILKPFSGRSKQGATRGEGQAVAK